MRGARLMGWKANHDITVGGALYFIDIAFLGAKLAVEIDGRLHENDPYVFENDRLRQNALVRSGWRVLRFTYAMLVNEPEYVIDAIRAALAQAQAGRA
jgi:very-short-patch-repair endonuclease